MITAVPIILFVGATIALWLAAFIRRRAGAPGAAVFVWLMAALALWCITSALHGLAPSLEEKIFNPFFTTKHSGHGLGLAEVQGIVRGHRGALHVDSTPGKGSRFCVWFPIAQQDSDSGSSIPRNPSALPSTSKS
jgi:K+-sensing histidine kinase KdpD